MDPTLARSDEVSEAARATSDRLRAVSDRMRVAVVESGAASAQVISAAISAALPRPAPAGFVLRWAPASVTLLALVGIGLATVVVVHGNWRAFAASLAPLLLLCLRRERGAVTWSLAALAVALAAAVALIAGLAVLTIPLQVGVAGTAVTAVGLVLSLAAPLLGTLPALLGPGRSSERSLGLTALWRLFGLVLVPIGLALSTAAF